MQVLRLINDLLKQPQLDQAPFTDLTELLNAGLYTLLTFLSLCHFDFIPNARLGPPLKLLSQRHEVHLCHSPMGSPRDSAAQYRHDCHGGCRDRGQLYVDTGDPAFRRRFTGRQPPGKRKLPATFRRAGVDAPGPIDRR
ncbi:MAG: hypothetical protein R2932_35975 [Caldilineaceae bacterium]